MTFSDTADSYSERSFGSATFSTFDPQNALHRAAAHALRDRLVAIGFGPQAAATLFGLSEIADIQMNRAPYYSAFVLPRNDAGQAARFFVLHDSLSESTVRTLLGDGPADFLKEMAAIVPTGDGWRSVVSITWFSGRLILADARAYNLIWPREPFDDYVMPPGPDSIGLLHVAPRTPRRSTVDVCCGAGAQAIAAAAYSERVVGVDLNPRALRFARVNAAINEIDNVRFVEGDCFEPLGAQTYDAIIANPPFVPWPPEDAGLLYRGGGARGDDVIARILAGAIERLHPDGSLTIVADFANSESLPARIRSWQGRPRRTLVLLQHAYDVVSYAESHAGHIPPGPERENEVVRLLKHFRSNGIASIAFGYIVQDGMPGAVFQSHTLEPRDRTIASDVAAFFAHQRELPENLRSNHILVLAPQLQLIEERMRSADGGTVSVYEVRPGAHSMLQRSTLTQPSFTTLNRIADGTLRPSDFEGNDFRAVRDLLERGLIRFITSTPP